MCCGIASKLCKPWWSLVLERYFVWKRMGLFQLFLENCKKCSVSSFRLSDKSHWSCSRKENLEKLSKPIVAWCLAICCGTTHVKKQYGCDCAYYKCCVNQLGVADCLRRKILVPGKYRLQKCHLEAVSTGGSPGGSVSHTHPNQPCNPHPEARQGGQLWLLCHEKGGVRGESPGAWRPVGYSCSIFAPVHTGQSLRKKEISTLVPCAFTK